MNDQKEKPKKKRQQSGMIYTECGRVFLRYYDNRVENGVLVRKRLRRLLGDSSLSAEQARDAADDFLKGVNSSKNPGKALSLVQFIEEVYLPRKEDDLRPSTIHGYKALWHGAIKPYVAAADLWIREVETEQMQDLLDELARTERFNKNSMKKIKTLLSGAFRMASRRGYRSKADSSNPMRETTIPRVRRAGRTHAATLDEITRLLTVVPHPGNIAIAVAAFAGCTRTEIRGLRWENYDGTQLMVDRDVWESFVTEVKAPSREAPIPVIPVLAKYLAFHRATQGDPTEGWIFPNTLGKPRCLNNLFRRVIAPAIHRCVSCRDTQENHKDHPAKFDHAYKRDTSVPGWFGWHAFRRGLATNLCQLGVPIQIAQLILRHSDYATTAKYYVKTTSADAQAAMAKLETALPSQLHEALDRKWTEKCTTSATPAVN